MSTAAADPSANLAEDAQVKDRDTNNLVEGFNNLNLVRQVALMVALASSVAIGFAVVLWTQGEDYRPLYAGLDRLDSNEVVQILETNDIHFVVDTKSGALLVAADQLHQARLKLAEFGLPGDSSIGFELLDQEQPLGTSQFMESARYKRSLEGELARTITSINSVRSSRVHLAIPKNSVFVRDAREPRASVFLELYSGLAIKQQQVRAIGNLIASSIPELKLENVTIVDQKGNLLSTGDDDPTIKKAMEDNGAAPAQPSNTRQQATRNFELDRSISYTKHQVGKVRRLSVAVVVDDREVVDPVTGERSYETWTDNEIERLSILIRDAVGYSAIRGDSVNVINTPFIDDGIFSQEIAEPPFWEQAWFSDLIKPFAGFLVVLVLFVGFLRPIIKTLARTGEQSREDEEAKQLAALEAAGIGGFDELSDETVTLSGGEALALPGPGESYDQMLSTVKGLIAEDPGRVSQVIKRWINDE